MGQYGPGALLALVVAISWLGTARAADEQAPPPGEATTEASADAPRGWNASWLSGEGQYVPRAGLGYEVGRGVGYPDSYGLVGGLIPLAEKDGALLLFSDLRLLVDNDGRPGSNLGLGYRYYLAELDRTFGAVVYHDLRQTDLKTFQQLTVSFDSLGSWCDLRTNVYVQSIFSDTASVPLRFSGNSLWLPGEDHALSGMDMELMVPLPAWGSLDPRVGAGWYHLQGASEDLWGWKLRAETRVGEELSVDLSLNRDDQFGTTLNLGVAMWLPNTWAQRRGHTTGRRPPSQRLGEPVKRQENIAIVSQSTDIARDPVTRLPLQFLHVAPTSGTGNGSIDAPYGTLDAALQDPRYQAGTTNIVYVHSPTDTPMVYAPDVTQTISLPCITLAAGTQLRSTGPVQHVLTQRGWAQLPGSGIDPTLAALPQIRSRVVLANDTYLSGFDITGTVVGTDVSNVTIAANRLRPSYLGDYMREATGPAFTGSPEAGMDVFGTPIFLDPSMLINSRPIELTRTSGSVVVRDNVITDLYPGDYPSYAIYLRDTQAAQVQVTRNTITNCETGIALIGGSMKGSISDNTITGSGREHYTSDWLLGPMGYGDDVTGYSYSYSGYSPSGYVAGVIPSYHTVSYGQALGMSSNLAFEGSITGNTFRDGHDGIGIHGSSTTGTSSFQFHGTIANNQISNNTGTGISLIDAGFQGEIRQNTITGNGEAGIAIGVASTPFQGELVSNAIRDNTGLGFLFLCESSGGTQQLSLRGNKFSGNRPEDVAIGQRSTAGTLVVDLAGNVCQDLVEPGEGLTNYDFVHFTSLGGHSYPGEFCLHLGENIGTVSTEGLDSPP